MIPTVEGRELLAASLLSSVQLYPEPFTEFFETLLWLHTGLFLCGIQRMLRFPAHEF
jgi:hypothetical protein